MAPLAFVLACSSKPASSSGAPDGGDASSRDGALADASPEDATDPDATPANADARPEDSSAQRDAEMEDGDSGAPDSMPRDSGPEDSGRRDSGTSGTPDSGAQDSGPLTQARCSPASGGPSGPVAAPVLITTLPASWDENWFASPAVANLDADPELEILAARHSVLYAWNVDGTRVFRAAFGQSASTSSDHGSTRMWASPVVGDFDTDGDIEIAVGSDASGPAGVNVALYDHRGELVPGWPVAFGDSEVRSIAAGDVDGDGVDEILVNKTSSGPTTAVLGLDGRMKPGWPQVSPSCDPPAPAESCWDFGGYNQNIGAADLDGDSVLDVISTYDAIGFGEFRGDGSPFAPSSSFTDRVVTAVEAYHDLALSRRGWGTGDRSEFTYSPPVTADVTGDGEIELVLAGDHEHSSSTANRGVTVWLLEPDLTRPTGWEWPKDTGMPIAYDANLGANIVHTMPSPATADLDGAPGDEILVPAYDGSLHAFNKDGELFSVAFGTSAPPYVGAAEPVIADLNGDGSPEIILLTYSSGAPRTPDTTPHLLVLDAAGHELHRVPLAGRGTMAAPTIADLDGDHDLELVISLKDTLGGAQGGVQIWNLPGSSDGCVLWGTGRGGPRRQGRAE